MAVLFSGATTSYSALPWRQAGLDDSQWTTFWRPFDIECFNASTCSIRKKNFELFHNYMGVCKQHLTRPSCTYQTKCWPFWPRNPSARTNNAKGNPTNRRSEIHSHYTVTDIRRGFIISPSTSLIPSGTTYILVSDSNYYCLRTCNSWNFILFITFPCTQFCTLLSLHKHHYRTQYCYFKSFANNSWTQSNNSFFKKRRTSKRCYFYGLFTETSPITTFITHAKIVVSKSLVNESSTRLQRDTSKQDELCWVSGTHIRFSAAIRCLHRRTHVRHRETRMYSLIYKFALYKDTFTLWLLWILYWLKFYYCK